VAAMQIKPGARFRSAACDLEVVVVKAPAGEDLDLRAGGHPMVGIDDEKPEARPPESGFDSGTLLGKRYTDAAGSLEVLCTKAGQSSLSIGDKLLELKEAKPLPSSD
jgi:hypothetical protein